MAYNKTNWQDTLRDAQGNVIQKGTPLNAQALGKIEEGIVQTEQKIDTEIGKVTTQLAQIAIDIKSYEHLKVAVANGYDWSPVFQHVFDLGLNKPINVLIPAGETFDLAQETTIRYPIKIEFKKGASIKSIKQGAENLKRGMFNVESQGVEINGGVINVNNVNMRGIFALNAHDLKISDLSVINAGMSGVYIDYSDRVTVKDLYLDNCLNSDYGDNRAGSLRFNYCNEISVDTTIIKNTNGKGLAFQSCNVFKVSKVFVNKTFYRSVGIYFNNSHYGDVTLCNVSEADGNALKFSRGSSNVSVTNSHFGITEKITGNANGDYVVLFQGAIKCSLSNCKVFAKNQSVGIRVEDHPDPEGSSTYAITIENNSIDMSGTKLSGYSPVAIEARVYPVLTGYGVYGINILNNTIYGGLQSIRITSVPNARIEGNNLNSNSSTAIQVTSADVVKGCYVKNNILSDIDGIGISLHKIEDFEVTGNEIKSKDGATSSTNGINIGDSCKTGIVSNNRIYGYSGNLINAAYANSDNINFNSNIGVGIAPNATRGLYYLGNNAKIFGNQFKQVSTELAISGTAVGITTYEPIASKSGITAFSGDGVKTTFTLLHGLGKIPKHFEAMANSMDAGNAVINYIVATSTNLTFYFKTAPIAGVDNVKIVWKVSDQ